MDETEASSKRRIGAMELLAIGGFSFFFGWMLVSFYWLFAEFIQDRPVAERDGIQLFVFIGITLGYLALHVVGKNVKFNLFELPVLVLSTVFALSLPLAALVLYFDIFIPVSILCTVNLLAGLGGAALTVSWLDVGSRIRIRNYAQFTGFSLAGGGMLFVFVALIPLGMQPVICIVYVLLSMEFLSFVSKRGERNLDCPPVDSCEDVWKFTWEIEPSLVAFGIVFGLTFVYLFNAGSQDVFIGLSFVIVGAGTIAIVEATGRIVGITIAQRILLCITVLACLTTPFVSSTLQLVSSCLVIASWAAFTSVNYATIVKKGVEYWKVPVFRQIPRRLVFSALGFLVGWGVATGVTMVYGTHSDMFAIVRLCMVFVLTLIVMIFYPLAGHHASKGEVVVEDTKTQPIVTLSLSEKELFERRCAAVADLYQLSPRETEILGFLAKGRNAAYIQSKLTISPHTVKSHIYSIYRKTDIHSQQKLMDFVETYAIDVSEDEFKSESQSE